MTDTLSNVAGTDMSSSISVAVARKALDAAKLEGAAAVSLIKAAGSVGASSGRQVAQAQPGEAGARMDLSA